ncbi:MAG: ribosome-associated translation inhibitor RaiA [Frankiaceae bacterium]|nr:ribosome-associated translation inhibitor RaiA [Frankiaceae bacterium]MBV9869150.1 ribosome-associated translation inhibitor RaiA [Frankiaceae bacterium]
MDIVVKSRNTDIDDRFRAVVNDKLGRLAKLDPKADRVDVELSEERNPRLADLRMRVELTCRTRGPVIRAEAAAADELAALDMAVAKLDMRLRRAADRRRVHHGSRTPVSVAAATSALASAGNQLDGAAAEPEAAEPDGDAPFVVREKKHVAAPMTLDQALFEMELVGHDFYLYVEAENGTPSVVYRRRGYDYGVVRLHEPDTAG